MKFYQFPILFSGKLYLFNKVFGVLLEKKDSNKVYFNYKGIPIYYQYQMVLNPFKLDIPTDDFDDISVSLVAALYAKLMVFTCKHSFIGAILLAKFPFVKYNSTKIAIASFKKIYPGSFYQRTLCLPRTLFAAATSKSFDKKGVAFIGVFLPSRKMHAWIIEDNSNPDPDDDSWICYQPVAAITKKL
ncbi:MAG TPA: hypothetical protein PK887_11390 [Ignavibacteriales bacterium]|jgi:hypothetical protein|nr:hypothetical protein [Ignavibacteriales bacterium]